MERALQVLSYLHSRGETAVSSISDQQRLKLISQAKFIICDSFFKNEIQASFYIEALEINKNINTVVRICEKMSEAKIKRSDEVLVIGGGVTGDIAGFACSIYSRGINWNFIPTTLLSQIDSCLGGKVGVNTDSGKNLLGQFHHPQNIYLSHSFLNTLPNRERLSGWGEIFKYNELIKETEAESLIHSFPHIPELSIIKRCLEIKFDYIKNDEFDLTGERALLNLGHTLGHAVEAASQYEISHGEAVWWGIIFELFYIDQDFTQCKSLMIYVPNDASRILSMGAKQLIEYMKKDKKGAMNFIISREVAAISVEDFEQTWNIFRDKFKTYENHTHRN